MTVLSKADRLKSDFHNRLLFYQMKHSWSTSLFFFSKKIIIRHMLEHVNVFCSDEAVNQDYPSFHGVMSNSPDVDVFNVSNVPMRTSCRENKAKMLKAECTLLLNRISPKSL